MHLMLVTGDIESNPVTQLPDADSQQLWWLQPSGIDGELLIVSDATKLVLGVSSHRKDHDDWPLLQEPNAALYQRWRLEKAPDQIGHLLHATNSGHVLTVADDHKADWHPYLWPRSGRREQQWLLVQPVKAGN